MGQVVFSDPPPSRRRVPRPLVAVVTALVALLTAAYVAAAGSEPGGSGRTVGGVTLRLGVMPNLTHASALAGIESGLLAEHLEPDRLEVHAVHAGPATVEALFAGALDAAFVGPGPALNAHARSGGRAVRVVAGATAGGAYLVVRPGIESPEDLRGAVLSTPQRGNTQDLALRQWLADHGLATTLWGGGEVTIAPQSPSAIFETFRAGAIDGAWVPEPWATRMVREASGRVLVDERDLWPGGRFATTVLVVRTSFLEDHPHTVARLLAGHLAATHMADEDPSGTQALVAAALERLVGHSLPPELLDAAWGNLTFTTDPLLATFEVAARTAATLGLLPAVSLDGLADLRLLEAAQGGRDQIATR